MYTCEILSMYIHAIECKNPKTKPDAQGSIAGYRLGTYPDFPNFPNGFPDISLADPGNE